MADGDASGKAFDMGASSALKDTEFTSGIHEDAKPRAPALGEKTTGGTPLLDKDGAIGKQFTTGGMIGSLGQKVGGPLAADGMIGKQFTEQGAIGGAIQQNLGKPAGGLGDGSTFTK